MTLREAKEVTWISDSFAEGVLAFESDTSWRASGPFKNSPLLWEGGSYGVPDQDCTFAPPNSPSSGGSPFASSRRRGMVIPSKTDEDKTFLGGCSSGGSDENASPVVAGNLDNTWFGYTGVEAGGPEASSTYKPSSQITIPGSAQPPPRTPLSGSHSTFVNPRDPYPYYLLGHDLTFRDLRGGCGEFGFSTSFNSNQCLNESNFGVLQNSLLDSARKSTSSSSSSAAVVSASAAPPRAFRQNFLSPEKDSPAVFDDDRGSIVQNKILDSIIQIFLKSSPGDENQRHILVCMMEMLSNGVIPSSDLCHPAFLQKASTLITRPESGDEVALFHLLSLFEKHLLTSETDSEDLAIISNYCAKPLGKLALKGHEELSARAEKLLIFLGEHRRQ